MKKILLVRFSSIGDLVLTTPVIRALSQQIKESEIHFLTKKRFVGILENNPYLTKIHGFEKDLKEVIPQLKKEKFDLVIDLHKNLRSNLVKINLGVKSISFDKLNLEKWLIVNLKINRLPEKHIVDRYFDMLKPLGIKNDFLGLDYFEGDENREIRKNLPEQFQTDYVVFALAGTYFTKKIPFEKWLEMAKLSPLPILLLGGSDEKELGEKLMRETLKQAVFNGCGNFNLNQSAALIREAELVITGDTGLMHIAAAYKKKTVSLWGNTIPEFGMYPYMPQNTERIIILENKDLACRPCSKLGYDKCPKGHFDCMMKLDVSNVFRQI
ncbi:MAG: glycosyltransferase family 9 protein [Flavobacteriaceae bacterium]|nr:glycosyltransferase family 9 protein [Flavobacteriaceae bacterium]